MSPRTTARAFLAAAGVTALAALAGARADADLDHDQIIADINAALFDGLSESMSHSGKIEDIVSRGLGAYSEYIQSLLPPGSDAPPPVWTKYGFQDYIAEQVDAFNTAYTDMYTLLSEEYCSPAGPIEEGEMQPAAFTGGSTLLTIDTGSCSLDFVDVPGETKKVGAEVVCTKPSVTLEKSFPTFSSKYKSATAFSFKSCESFSADFGEAKEYFLSPPGEEFVIPLYSLPPSISMPTADFMGIKP